MKSQYLFMQICIYTQISQNKNTQVYSIHSLFMLCLFQTPINTDPFPQIITCFSQRSIDRFFFYSHGFELENPFLFFPSSEF